MAPTPLNSSTLHECTAQRCAVSRGAWGFVRWREVPCSAVPCPTVRCCALLMSASFRTHNNRYHAKHQVPQVLENTCTTGVLHYIFSSLNTFRFLLRSLSIADYTRAAYKNV